jgi:hypothetical protein
MRPGFRPFPNAVTADVIAREMLAAVASNHEAAVGTLAV